MAEQRPRINLTAPTPFDLEIGEAADMSRFNISVGDEAKRLTIGPLTFEKYIHRDPTGYKTVYWKRVA